MVMKIKNQMKVFNKLLKGIVEKATDKEVMKEVGHRAVEQIKRRTKLGKDTKDSPLKALKPSYREQRKKLDLHARGRPNKSNLTKTGELMDSLEVTDVKPRSVEIGVSGQRSDGGDNADVGYWVEKNGRKFMGLSPKDKIKITKFYDKIVKDLTRKANNKR